MGSSSQKVDRTLLVQTSFLGDTVLSTPVISGIHQAFPGTELWTLTTALSEPIVRRDPLVNKTLVFEKRGADSGIAGLWRLGRKLRAYQFSRAFVLHRSWRTALLMLVSRIPLRFGFEESALPWAFHTRVRRDRTEHEVLRNLSVLKPRIALDQISKDLRVFPPDESTIGADLLQKLPPTGEYVVLVPGSVWATKRWSWERYRELALGLLGEGKQVVILGAREEETIAAHVAEGSNALNLCGETSIDELIFCISRAQAVVCNDSVALHIASAFKVPTVAVFCATSPSFGFGPWMNPRAEVVEREGLACKPCSRHGGPQCPIGTSVCMTEVTARVVREALVRLGVKVDTV